MSWLQSFGNLSLNSFLKTLIGYFLSSSGSAYLVAWKEKELDMKPREKEEKELQSC